MQQFKSFHRVSIQTPEGVIALGQNVPEVSFDGKLRQGNVTEMLKFVVSNLDHDLNITDIKMEEIPLEGDYKLRAPTDYYTDQGLAFALASILNWKSPLNGAEITYKADEGIYVNNPVEIFNLNDAFKTFDPVNDLALCMSILQLFKVQMRYDSKSGAALIRPRPDITDVNDATEIRREICREAIESRAKYISDCGWDGTIHLSMVKQSVLTIAAMAETHPELVKDLPVWPGQQETDPNVDTSIPGVKITLQDPGFLLDEPN